MGTYFYNPCEPCCIRAKCTDCKKFWTITTSGFTDGSNPFGVNPTANCQPSPCLQFNGTFELDFFGAFGTTGCVWVFVPPPIGGQFSQGWFIELDFLYGPIDPQTLSYKLVINLFFTNNFWANGHPFGNGLALTFTNTFQQTSSDGTYGCADSYVLPGPADMPVCIGPGSSANNLKQVCNTWPPSVLLVGHPSP